MFDLQMSVQMFLYLNEMDVLEPSNTDAKDHQTNGEASQGTPGVANNRGQRRHDQNNMAQDRKRNRDMDGLESTPELICNPRTHKRSHVAPESVDWPVSIVSNLAMLYREYIQVVRPVAARWP